MSKTHLPRKRATEKVAAPILEILAFNALLEMRERIPGRIIRLPDVYARLGRVLHLTRSQSWLLLKSMESLGWIEVVPRNGILLPRNADAEAKLLPNRLLGG